MKAKGLILAVLAITVAAAVIIFIYNRELPDAQLAMHEVNDMLQTLSARWEGIRNGEALPLFTYEIDYVILDRNGGLIAASRDGLNETLFDAIRNRDTIVDIEASGEVVGKILFNNDSLRMLRQDRMLYIFVLILFSAAVIVIILAYALHLHITFFRPFKKLQGFARHVASGNLDFPLAMDKNNLFGAFSESFDLMREELRTARENERKAERNKKELVASLSHDIKTPVASIKSAVEVMLLTEADAENREQLEGINAKAEQIDGLITNMFHATLEELQALRVTPAEHPSTAIPNIIRLADYERKVKVFSIPECLIYADLQRLQQIFDNIIGNAYKYAGSDIFIRSYIEEKYLAVEIRDEGAGVPEDELPLLTHKFFRGKAASDKSGYGLGLYIAKYIMEAMQGQLRCENREKGFAVTLMLSHQPDLKNM